METLSKKVIVDTLSASEEYTKRLEVLLQSILDAEDQIRKSSLSAVQMVESTFDNLQTILLKALDKRKTFLLSSVKSHEKEAYAPLSLCKQEIMMKMIENNLFIDATKSILKRGGFTSEENCNDFIDKSSLLGTLPAVPDLELVPNITFSPINFHKSLEIQSFIDDIGRVHKIGPVQITSIEQRPGALFVKWEEIDFESQVDFLSYKLQISFCHVGDSNAVDTGIDSFHDIYTGPELEYLVRDLRPFQAYSFRVCSRISTSSEWSSWSLVKSASTELLPFTWDLKNECYAISNENKLASILKTGPALYSVDAQVTNGASVQFTLLTPNESQNNDGVGLTCSNLIEKALHNQRGAIIVTFNGEIFIDGAKKMIKFPKMEKNSKVIFSCEQLQKKWRINIECGNKGVTYEWHVTADRLFFVAELLTKSTQVLVE